MNTKLLIMSPIYRFISEDPNFEFKRDQRVAVAIDIFKDLIFLALYYRKTPSTKSVSHLNSIIGKSKSLISQLLNGVNLNSTEISVFSDFNELISVIQYGSSTVRVVGSIDSIESIIDKLALTVKPKTRLIESLKFVLAVANQIDYTTDEIIIPHIKPLTDDTPYGKENKLLPISFKINRSPSENCAYLWYRIFKGLIFTKQSDDTTQLLKDLCSTINIGTLPDVVTGLGIYKFNFEAYLSSSILKIFVDQINGELYDRQMVISSLLENNTWMDKDNNNFIYLNSPSLEADYSDQVSPGEEDPNSSKTKDDDEVPPSKSSDDETPPVDETAEAADVPTDDDKSDKDTTPAEDASSEADLTADNSEDQVTNENDDNPSEDGLDNESDAKPKLLGLDLALPKNETLDSFMYKVSVAKFIDNVIEFNHDDLPLETVELLRKWKSTLLFLTDAEETKRLLRSLKLKLK